MQSITVYDIADLLEITEGLVKRGLTFTAQPDGACWVITLTGGF